MVVHRLSKQHEDISRINLLLIDKDGETYYTCIKDLNRRLHDQSKYNGCKHFCERCLHAYSLEELLEVHRPECNGIGQTAMREEMPEEGGKHDLLSKLAQAATSSLHYLC